MPVKVEDICHELDLKFKKIISNKKHSNYIIELLKNMQTNNKQQVRIHASSLLTKLFNNYFTTGDIIPNNNIDLTNNDNLITELKFKSWLRKQYDNFTEFLLENLDSSNRREREKGENLDSIFMCIKDETKTNKNSNGECVFTFNLFHKTLEKLLKNTLNIKLAKKLIKYFAYVDIRYFALKYIHDNLEENKNDNLFIENLIVVLSLMPGLVKGETNDEKNLFVLQDLSENSNLISNDYHRKLFSDCVFKLINFQLNTKLFKRFLIKFPEKLLPKMSNPLMCTDFLNESYKIGGLVSILALNGLYVLISKYNIEIPEFYKKLYEQLNAAIFGMKYKNRYFALLDICLSSTHLSVYLVACFIKKISRLLLFAPVCDLKLLLRFIKNLLVRHPSCRPLIHRSNGNRTILEDPFDITSTNLNQTSVMSSSLWEIEAISNHYSAEIAQEIKQLKNLPTHESDIYELLDTNDFDEMLNAELNKEYKTCPLLYVYDKNSFQNSDFYS